MEKTRTLGREALVALSDAARLLKTLVDRRAAESGVTKAQWGTLTRIERSDGPMQAEVAEQMDLQPISLVPILDKLCDQGLIERRADPVDRRAKRLFITDRGRALLANLGPVADRISSDVFNGMDPHEVSRFLALLGKIKDNIKQASEPTRTPQKAMDNAR